MVETINKDVDLVYSADDGGYYLQQYKNDGSGSTRTSRIFKNKDRLIALYNNGVIKWGNWD